MNSLIAYELSLFRDGKTDNIIEIDDSDFIINTLINLSRLRPQQYELVIALHQKYLKMQRFREKFLEKVLKKNCLFVSHLIDKKIYNSNDFGNGIADIIDFSKQMIHVSFPEGNTICLNPYEIIEKLIETSYSPGTIDYCLRFDDIDHIRSFFHDPSFFQNKAHVYEIENIISLDIDWLGYCGFFGSIKCFKYLLETNQYKIDQQVIECSICGGSIEIVRLCLHSIDLLLWGPRLIFLASSFNNLDLLHFFYENGVDLNSKNEGGQTILHVAAQYGHLSVVDYLFNKKVDVNSKDNDDKF